MSILQRLMPIAVLAVAVIGAGPWPLAGAEASVAGDWAEGPHTKARLIAARWDGGAAAEIAIEIRLERGWKTYWRNPGDAGVPPRLDWSGSQNLKSTSAAWPVPVKLPDPYGQSIGYKGNVVVPVRLGAEEAGKPIKIRLDLEYGVCAEVCIPVNAKLSLDLAPGGQDGRFEALIADWKARTPAREAGASGLSVSAVQRLTGGKTGLMVSITGKGGLTAPDLLVEGPEAFYFSIPELVSKQADRASFKIMIDGADDAGALMGHSITLTLIDGKRAQEITWPLGKGM